MVVKDCSQEQEAGRKTLCCVFKKEKKTLYLFLNASKLFGVSIWLFYILIIFYSHQACFLVYYYPVKSTLVQELLMIFFFITWIHDPSIYLYFKHYFSLKKLYHFTDTFYKNQIQHAKSWHSCAAASFAVRGVLGIVKQGWSWQGQVPSCPIYSSLFSRNSYT